MQKSMAKVRAKAETTLQNLFYVAYFMGKENIAFAKFPKICALLKAVDTSLPVGGLVVAEITAIQLTYMVDNVDLNAFTWNSDIGYPVFPGFGPEGGFMKRLPFEIRDVPLKDIWTMIDTSKTLSTKYQTLRKLAAIARVQCVSTAQYERAFSIQNHIKDKYRNTLIVARLDALIHIDLEGPELEDLPEFNYPLITQGYDDHCHEKTLEPLSLMPKTKLPVAVKRVSNDSKQGTKEFVAEVSIISHLRHRNIVRLLGWCGDRDKLLLVYELMPNGSLDKALFHEEEMVLSWEHRFKIIKGLAAAL
ncbi:hypothetical protein R1flu_018535 [Riccia fluitans]|uniref:Protein kinase domain-containing protein n=1 Tax=Riccia fluitans TaxID=41844 RepID=A0ABD1ZH49_9MARC